MQWFKRTYILKKALLSEEQNRKAQSRTFVMSIGVGRFRIWGARFRILGRGGKGGGLNFQQAYDVVMTSMRRHFDVMCPLGF